MKPVIDFTECLKDSPKFRNQLQQNESNLEELETKIEKMVKLCNVMTEGGRTYITQQTQFLASCWEMSSYFAAEKDVDTTSNFNKLIHALQEIIKFQNVVVDQAQNAVAKALTKFLKEDVKQMKDTRGYFNKISADFDSALNKNAVAYKPNEIEDCNNLFTATKSCFRYTTLDYVFQISMIQSKKKHEVLDALQNLILSFAGFFQQGTDLFDQLEPHTTKVGDDIVSLRQHSKTLQRNLDRRHTYINDSDHTLNPSSDVAIEGYLFKRGQNPFRTWNRRWFYLQKNQLCYSKRTGEEVTVIEDDLRICLVRPLTETDRRFCFEIISPTKSHVLQADSEDTFKAWISTLQQGISSALHETIHHENKQTDSPTLQWDDSDNEEQDNGGKRTTRRRSAKQILLIPGNEYCCDCGSPDPQWASINLGITLCIDCCGVHRSFGVHISKVRSITLDGWEPEILKVMAELGNEVVNRIYEAEADDSVAMKPTATSTKAEREAWSRAKYVSKSFIRRKVLSQTRENKNCKWMVKRLRRRTRNSSLKKQDDKERRDRDDKDEDTTSLPVMNVERILFGASLGRHHLANIELDSDQESTDGEDAHTQVGEDLDRLTPDRLLFWSARVHNLPVMSQALALGADLDWISPQSQSSVIHQSIQSGSVMACEFLLLNGAKINAADGAGNTPLHLAAVSGHTGLVCLLLKHRADHHIRNGDGQQALDIAVQKSDADIVTVLRLASLNEEIRENDMVGDDDTFNDIVQEFSQMVYTHPERLNKKS